MVAAGLFDALLGGGSRVATSNRLPIDDEGEALKHWMEERGLPPQKVSQLLPAPPSAAAC